MRLFLDAHLSEPRIANPLRTKGHDVRALSEETGAEELDDDEVLVLATAERRIRYPSCLAAEVAAPE